ncbi:efflux RND transporter periplasmic adaptor subunit [Luteolibacter soli]|uniref:Efflux RND transporter periplasmic adaptor subunit n=1 Tax=Luteolibacter soli TaxID=3135280 RepID=A0ABU9B054_9BACT
MNVPDRDEYPIPEAPEPKSRFHTRLALMLVGIGAVAAGVYYGPRASAAESKHEAPAMAPAKVTVSTVEQQTLAEHRELIGRVDARETVEIRPRVPGHIDDVRFQAGSVVEKGDILFVIDPRQYRAQVDLAAAAVERAKVRVGIAESEAKRTGSLLATRAVSVEESDTRNSRLAEARTDLSAAEATLVSAKLNLEYTEVRAPIRGKVNRALVTAGNLVSSENLLTTVVSTGDVYVYADVDENTALAFDRLRREKKMGEGQLMVEMQVGDEKDYPHRGFIESADNRVDAATGTLVYRMIFSNEDESLVPGLYARVRLPVSAPAPALLVSERSIGTNQSQKFVLTVKPDNTVAYRTVKLGPVLQGKRVIREGIEPGDRVIVNGLQRVTAGMIVDPAVAN